MERGDGGAARSGNDLHAKTAQAEPVKRWLAEHGYADHYMITTGQPQ